MTNLLNSKNYRLVTCVGIYSPSFHILSIAYTIAVGLRGHESRAVCTVGKKFTIVITIKYFYSPIIIACQWFFTMRCLNGEIVFLMLLV